MLVSLIMWMELTVQGQFYFAEKIWELQQNAVEAFEDAAMFLHVYLIYYILCWFDLVFK